MLILSNKMFRHVVSGCVAAALALAAFQVQGVQVSTQQRQAKAEFRLQKEVRHVLVTQPFYTVFDNLAYKVEGDRVTLLGQVVTPTLKSDAANAVKSIESVSAVDNQSRSCPSRRTTTKSGGPNSGRSIPHPAWRNIRFKPCRLSTSS